MLASFVKPLRAVVVGAGGGIGGAFLAALQADPAVGSIDATARRPLPRGPRTRSHAVDLLDDVTLDGLAASLGEGPPLDLVIVATGALHGAGLTPEKTWRQLDRGTLARAFEVNAIGPALVAKRLLPLLARDRKAVFAVLSARVGSIEDNQLGGWYGYRAAKAALNQLVRTASIELGRRAPQAVCVGLHPGTVDTGLSRPFQAGVAPERLFDAAFAAERMLEVLDRLDAADSGRLFAWDGAAIPF